MQEIDTGWGFKGRRKYNSGSEDGREDFTIDGAFELVHE